MQLTCKYCPEQFEWVKRQGRRQEVCGECTRKRILAQSTGWKKRNPGKARESSEKWKEKNRSRVLSVLRISSVEVKYGISEREYLDMVAKSKGLCDICNLEKLLSVDHSHRTGKVRGLICNNCNVGIGHFKDSPALLKSAAKYLATGK